MLHSASVFSQTCNYGNCDFGFGSQEYEDGITYTGYFVGGDPYSYGMQRQENGTEYHGFFMAGEKHSWGLTRNPESASYTLSFANEGIPNIEIEIEGNSFQLYHKNEGKRKKMAVQPGCIIGECSDPESFKWYVYQKENSTLLLFAKENNESEGKGILFRDREMFLMEGPEPTAQLMSNGVFYFGEFDDELRPHGYGMILSDGKIQFNGEFKHGEYSKNRWTEGIPVPLTLDPYYFFAPEKSDFLLNKNLFVQMEIEYKYRTLLFVDPLGGDTFEKLIKLLKAMTLSIDGLKATKLESGSFDSKIQVLEYGRTEIRSDDVIEIRSPESFSYSEALYVATNLPLTLKYNAFPNWHFEETDSGISYYECENKNEGRQIKILKPNIYTLQYDNLTSVRIWITQNSSNYCDDTLVEDKNSAELSVSRALTERELKVAETASRSLTSNQHVETIQKLHTIFSGSEDIKSQISGNCDEENGTCTSSLNLSDLGFTKAVVSIENAPAISWESAIVGTREIRGVSDPAVAEIVVKNYAERLEKILPELANFNKSEFIELNDNEPEPVISYLNTNSDYLISIIGDYITNGRFRLYQIKLKFEKLN